MPKISWSRWALIVLFTGGLFLGGRPADAYTVSNCFGSDLYIDFYSSGGQYQGTIIQRNAPACKQNQYSG